MRLDMRLPFVGDALRQAHVPSTTTSYAYRLFHSVLEPFQGVGRGARSSAPRVSEEDRFRKLHCGRCMKELSAKAKNKAPNKGAAYRNCLVCYFELRAEEDPPTSMPLSSRGRQRLPLLVRAKASIATPQEAQIDRFIPQEATMWARATGS